MAHLSIIGRLIMAKQIAKNTALNIKSSLSHFRRSESMFFCNSSMFETKVLSLSPYFIAHWQIAMKINKNLFGDASLYLSGTPSPSIASSISPR